MSATNRQPHNKSLQLTIDPDATSAIAKVPSASIAAEHRRQMAQALAWPISPPAWFAPLAAPIGALVLIPDEHQRSFAVDWLWAFLIGGYLFFALVVIPIFWLTRNSINWTMPRIVGLGGVLAIAPFALAFGVSFIDALLRGRAARFAMSVVGNSWSICVAFVLSAISVAFVFCIIQKQELRSGAI